MWPTKALGPDGLPAAFFQKHWNFVREVITITCLHILNEQGNLAPLNHTYTALIPKKKKKEKTRDVVECWPISLCNVMYRVIAKSISNRLKQILRVVISSNQSVFIPNRLITDNMIIGYNVYIKLKWVKRRKKG